MKKNAADLYRFLNETNSVIGVSPPFYIQIIDDDCSRAYKDAIVDVIRASGRPNPEEVDFTTGDLLEVDGKRFMEFRCMAGSVWCLILQAVKKGTVKRCIAHVEDRGNISELRIIEPEK